VARHQQRQIMQQQQQQQTHSGGSGGLSPVSGAAAAAAAAGGSSPMFDSSVAAAPSQQQQQQQVQAMSGLTGVCCKAHSQQSVLYYARGWQRNLPQSTAAITACRCIAGICLTRCGFCCLLELQLQHAT
jgi:hypothetical protein